MTGTKLTTFLARIGTILFTERVLMNLVVLLTAWLIEKNSSDLDKGTLELMRNQMNRKDGKRVKNLYKGVRTCDPK